jgi:hypothetical protein
MLEKMEAVFGDLTDPYHETVVRGARNRQVGFNKAVMKAHALDARYKTLGDLPKASKAKIWKGILKEMLELEGDQPPSARSPPRKKRAPNREGEEDLMNHFAHAYAQQDDENTDGDSEDSTSLWEEQCKGELRRYKAMKPALMDENPLEWWRKHHHIFPILWLLAQIYLALPATSAPSERAFSKGGLIITALRNRLTPSNVEDLHFLGSNFQFLYDARASRVEEVIDEIEALDLARGE